MNIRQALEAEQSKAQTLRITAHIGGSQKRFQELLAILFGEEGNLPQRAAWVLKHCAEAHPDVVRPHLGALLENLRRPGLHDAVKRNTMKVATELELPDEIAGLAADLAFDLLASPGEAVAIKVYSMAVLERLCQREPALVDELRLVITHQLPFEKKPAFRSRARHVLRRLDRL